MRVGDRQGGRWGAQPSGGSQKAVCLHAHTSQRQVWGPIARKAVAANSQRDAL